MATDNKIIPISPMPGMTLAEHILAAMGVDMSTTKDAKVVRATDKDVKTIIVPAGMKLKEASDWLLRKDREEEKLVNINHTFDCFPLDGCVCLREALDEIFGFVANVDIPGGWFRPDQPPVLVGVPISMTEIKQIPWGRVEIPGFEGGWLQTSMESKPRPKFILVGQVKQRYLADVELIVHKLRETLATRSIYKGKAVRLDLSWLSDDEEETFNPTLHAPKFTIPVDKINVDDLVLPASVRNDIELGLFTPIEHTEFCRAHKIPLKRGVLLAGEPGVGKSMTAYVTAKKAVENGWTFVYLTRAKDLAAGFHFAAQYAPCVLFVEDVDRVVSGQERTEAIDEVLNAFDGVDTKDHEIITVLTTNNLDSIPPVALRQGRCDTLVKITRPDDVSAGQLVRLYGRGLIADDADYEAMGQALADHIPAEIREAVERAKLAAIRRLSSNGTLKAGGTIAGYVREQDVLDAVKAMRAQHKLLEPKVKDNTPILERAADALGSRIAGAIINSTKDAAVAAGMLQAAGMPANELYRASTYLDSENDLPEEEFSAK